MSEPSNGAWPFQEIPEEEGLDISAIFGDSSAAPQGDPFAPPAAAQSVPSSPTPVAQEITPAVAATSQPTTAPIAKAPVEAPAENPIAAAFEQKTAENTKKGLLEKPPVFYHKGVKEEIDDPSMTFEELRIRKSDDFTDLEEGKRVSWSVEYCGIRKEVKDPKGTTIISMKEMIERSREFLDALKKTKDKDPCCYVKPKVEMKTKGNAAYKGKFGTLEEARNSDKVICLIPSNDGRIYELRKMEQGEFIAPKKNVVDFSEVRAGFSPALPKIPAELMGQIIAFFRAFMTDHGENEAFAQIYWDKAEKRFFAYVPKQSVCKEEVEANLHDCPYDDEERYLCYADIHSHNSMDAFFSGKDDQDERSTGLYLVLGKLDKFYPDVKARIFCGDSFVSIDPNIVMEGLEQPFPKEWLTQVSIRSRKSERFKKPDICRILVDNFDDLTVWRFTESEFRKFKQVAVLGIRKPRGTELQDTLWLEELASAPMSIRSLAEMPEERYALPDHPIEVNTFKGERFNQKELEQQLRRCNSFAQMMARSELDSGVKRPLLPLSISQIGLIGGSGMINGLIACDTPHIIKGRIVKVIRTESEEKFSAQGNHIGSEVKETITNKMIFNVLTPNGFKALT